MKKTFPLLFNYSIGLLVILVYASIGQIQGQNYQNNPVTDPIPDWYLNQAQNQTKLPSQIITVDDFDNYYLGVDFAECHITVNPNNPTEFFTSFNIDAPYRTSDGHDWLSSNVTGWGATIRGDIVMAYDSIGNLYYENMYGSSSILGCKVAVSQNNGQSWNSVQTAISGGDKNWIAADQTGGPYSNYVYTTMTSTSYTSGNFARSTNNGSSWSNTYTFSTQNLPGMMVCIGPNGDVQGGSVYVVTNGGNAFAPGYTFYRSTNGGSSFQNMSTQYFAGYVGVNSNGRHSVENMRTRPYPFITADNSYGANRGRLYVIFASNDPPGNGNKPDIWCRYSDNSGSSWSSAIRVNDDVNPQSNHQFAPATWCDYKTGKLYVQWMDTRDCPTSDSALIYGTYSDDGGETFYPNVAISNEKMKINCFTCGASGSPRYQGDYNGIVSNSKVSMAVWTDFRYGSFASFTGYLPDFAMRVYPETKEISYQDTIWAVIPDVKLFSDTAEFYASVEDPSSGEFTLSFPEGNMLTTFPDSIPIVITADGVPLGEYEMSVTGQGTNGTPVHHRDATLVLAELPLPVVEFAASDTTPCTGTSVDFTDQTQFFPTQWFWTFEGGNPGSSQQQNPSGIVYNTPGTYDVTLYAVNSTGFTELTKSDYITVNVAPDPPVGEDVTVCLPGTIPPLMVNGENVNWYDDPEMTNLVNTGTTYETGLTEPGTYTFYVTQANGGCESEPLLLTLILQEMPDPPAGEDMVVCSSDTIPALEVTGENVIWYDDPGLTNEVNTGSTYETGLTEPGTYIFYVTQSLNGCVSDAFEISLVIVAAPEPPAGEDSWACLPGPVPPLVVSGENVIWYDDPGLTNIVNSGAAFETGQTEPGTYTYYATQANDNCESEPLMISLHINMKPEATFGPMEDVCDNIPVVELTGGSPAGGIYYGNTVEEGIFYPPLAGPGMYNIGYIYTDENFCSDTAMQTITVLSSPAPDLGIDTTLCADVSYTLDASLPDAISYLWSPGGQTTASITVDSTGIGLGSQDFTVVVEYENGCAGADEATIAFKYCSGIHEIDGLNSLSVFPNPNSGKFTLRMNSSKPIDLNYKLFNARGSVVVEESDISFNGEFDHEISIDQAKPGIFYLRLDINGNEVVTKILIK